MIRGAAEDLIVDYGNNTVRGVVLGECCVVVTVMSTPTRSCCAANGEVVHSSHVIITTGTFLRARLHIGARGATTR